MFYFSELLILLFPLPDPKCSDEKKAPPYMEWPQKEHCTLLLFNTWNKTSLNKESFQPIGNYPDKKLCFLIAPPPPPHLGNLVLFFGTSKTMFCNYDGIKCQRWQWWLNDNYDNNGDNDEENDQKTYQINDFLLKVY